MAGERVMTAVLLAGFARRATPVQTQLGLNVQHAQGSGGHQGTVPMWTRPCEGENQENANDVDVLSSG
jgi:hypothetical protein